MSESSIPEFYDDLASSFHLVYADWEQAVAWQGDVLHRLIRQHLPGPDRLSVLDCACGIGTQALGLAMHGYQVYGTDISPAAIERARQEALRLGIEAQFDVADMRHLAESITGQFDVVIACDNALPHLLTDADLGLALRQVAARLRPGGLFLASIRDYDSLIGERPVFNGQRVLAGPAGRHIVFQLWDWDADPGSSLYTLNLFILLPSAPGWETRHFATRYRALLRAELSAGLARAGFARANWDDTTYFQPIVIATWNG